MIELDLGIDNKRNILTEIKSGEYFLSFSRLKRLAKQGVKAFLDTSQKDSDSMIFGKAIEVALFEKEKFKKDFFVMSAPKLTSKLKVFTDAFYQAKEVEGKYIRQALREAFSKADYSKNTKLSNVIKAFKQKAIPYYKDCLIRDKKEYKYLLNEKTFIEINEAIQLFESNKEIADLLKKSNHKDHFLQFEFRSQLYGIKVKGFLDLIILDHINRTIQIIDLKSTDMEVRRAAKEFRWDIQGAFYYDGIKTLHTDNPISYYLHQEGYRLLNPLFIIYQRKKTTIGSIHLLEMTDKDLDIARNGAVSSFGTLNMGSTIIDKTFNIQGYHQWIEKYKQHLENWNWEEQPKSLKRKMNLWF